MEVSFEQEEDMEVDFRSYSPEQKLELIEAICDGLVWTFTGTVCGVVDVEPPEYP